MHRNITALFRTHQCIMIYTVSHVWLRMCDSKWCQPIRWRSDGISIAVGCQHSLSHSLLHIAYYRSAGQMHRPWCDKQSKQIGHIMMGLESHCEPFSLYNLIFQGTTTTLTVVDCDIQSYYCTIVCIFLSITKVLNCARPACNRTKRPRGNPAWALQSKLPVAVMKARLNTWLGRL